MQSDAHHAHPHSLPDDASPLPTPTSPTLTAFHRPQPTATPTVDTQTQTPSPPSEPFSGLRRRLAPPTDDAETMRIGIATPFGDTAEGSRRKEGWSIPRSKLVEELKDELAAGEYGLGGWNREGMRLVYQGRIVRDQERLGEVVGKMINPAHTYVFHLVARRGPPTPLPRFEQSTQFSRQPSRLASPSPQPTSAAQQSPPASDLPATTSPLSATVSVPITEISVNTLALGDTIHYLLFTARHHLFCLLGRTPLGWDDTVPPPIVNKEKAREAVMSVVRSFAAQRSSREEGWEHWEDAFEGDTQDGLKAVWQKMGRTDVEKAVRSLWAANVGRSWDDQVTNEQVDVEVDGRTYSIHLPQLREMTPSQLSHFLVYLRIVSLLPLLSNVLEQSLLPSVPQLRSTTTFIPTPTIALPPGRIIYRRQFRLVVPYIPMSVLQHVFFSALKVGAMIWMLTRGMRWGDMRFWIIAGAAGGWWVADGAAQLAQFRRQNRTAGPQAEAQAAEPQAAAPAQQPPADGAPAPAPPAQGNPQATQGQGDLGAQAQAIRATIAAGRRGGQSSLLPSIPHFHLDVDAAQLRLPRFSRSSSNIPSVARPLTAPPRWQTQLVLPVLLWFLTLIPEWESLRARAIRRRERRMRAVVEQLNSNSPSPSSSATAEAGAGAGAEQGGEGETPTQTQTQQRAPTVPDGLSVQARKYYLRTIERGEGIDWEEEREAQRALGVGEEQEDEGMRLRMF